MPSVETTVPFLTPESRRLNIFASNWLRRREGEGKLSNVPDKF